MTPLAQLVIHKRTQSNCESDNGFCPSWIADNWHRYEHPFLQHVYLTLIALAIGFVIAGSLGLIAHRRRWVIPPVVFITGVMYTIPSLSLFFLLQPVTGRGNTTALVALVSYTLLIIFRNVIVGLDGVAPETRDAARGVGLTDRQLLWRVEVPLALPEIMAGLRVAATTTVGLATLAFFAGAGGLGGAIFADLNFKSNVIVAGGLCVLLAFALDLLILGVQRALTPWRKVRSA
ncbi:MAG TPA: ABC transporter permease [Thermoleophilaceae bacterium]|jgi:osmoprotectant transport system permease protein|nr:ABC transporter permease [Thermoleophilaceae bacterium]